MFGVPSTPPEPAQTAATFVVPPGHDGDRGSGNPVGGAGPPDRPGRAGLRRPAADRSGGRPAPAPGPRPGRPAPDRLGQRPGPVALPAGLRPARALPAGAARPARLGRVAARAVRILGARGIADPA